MSKRKIYLLRLNKSNYGGAEVYLSRLSNCLIKKNINHQIVNSIFPNFLPSWLRVILFNLQVSISKRNKFYFSLDRVICPDIYRAGDGVHKTFLRIEKKSKLNPLHPLYLLIEKRCFIKAKKIIAISEMVKKNIINDYEIDAEKISVIHNGIELKKFDYDSALKRLSNEFKFKDKSQIILFVGSGFQRKGVKEFLNIFSSLKKHDVIAFIVGKDKNISEYKAMATKLGVENKVYFTGARVDVEDFYTISDIFLFPTHYEPFGNVILEAMNLKNVVFTTNFCGGGELLDKDFIMQGPNDSSVVAKIDFLLKNSKELKKIKEKNRIISKQFSIEKNLELTLEKIDEVIN